MSGSTRFWSVWLTVVLTSGVAVAGTLPDTADLSAAEGDATPSSSAKSLVSKSDSAKPAGNAPTPLSSATKSGLPVPGNARVLVDALSAAPTGSVVRPGVARTLRVLIFQPEGDHLTWAQLNQLYTEKGVLLPSARPVFSMVSGRKSRAGAASAVSVGPEEETNLYASGNGETLVLGMRRGAPFPGMVAYAVVLAGVTDTTRGTLYARQTVSRLAASALGLTVRVIPAEGVVSLVPAGAAAAGPQSRLQGAALQQLLAGIQQAPQLSPQVRRLTVGLISQATTVTYSSWRTVQPLSTKNFFAFYTQPAIQRTWGLPLTRDETDPDQPTVLFQRSDTRAVVMIRAQPGPVGANGKASTSLFILEMEGNINVSTLLGK